MRFAKWVFWSAGVYGLLVITPMYFTEARFGADHPPAITHPEFYYGFAGVTLAWQFLFCLIGTDPSRFRPAMPVAMLEKATFAVAVPILHSRQPLPMPIRIGATLDAVLLVLFAIAFVVTRPPGKGAAKAKGQ
jgi:hypothetical protein